MDTLFANDYVNTQPLRKYEPIIRFDSEGRPQPRRLFDEVIKNEPEVIKNEPKIAGEELKRKEISPPTVSEPKKKVQKQSSITAFFKKS